MLDITFELWPKIVVVLLTLQHSCGLGLKVFTLGSHLRRKQSKAEEDKDTQAEKVAVGAQLHRVCLEAGRLLSVTRRVRSLCLVGVGRQGLFDF